MSLASKFAQKVGRQYGIEDEMGVLPEGDVPETPIPDAPGETLEGGMGEAAQAELDVAGDQEELTVLEESGEILTEVGEGIESAMSRGGLTPEEARAYGIALRAAMRPFGLVKSATASLEGIGTDSNPRMSATRITLESVKETLKQWWESFKAQLEKLSNTIKGWLLKLFDNIPRIKERANALIKKAGETKGSPKEPKIKLGLLKALRIGAGAPSASALDGGIDAIKTATESIIGGKTADANKAAVSELTTIVSSLGEKADMAKVEAAVTSIHGKLSGRATAVGAGKDAGDRFSAEGVTAKVTEEMIGGKVIVVKWPTDVKKEGKTRMADDIVRSSAIEVADGSEFKGEAKAEFETLSTDNVKALATKVVAICDSISGYKALWQNRDTEKKAMDKAVNTAIEKATKDVSGEGSGETVKAVKSVGVAVGTLWTKNVKFESSFISYVSKTLASVLDYCNSSLNSYGEGAAKTEGDAKPAEGDKKPEEGAAK